MSIRRPVEEFLVPRKILRKLTKAQRGALPTIKVVPSGFGGKMLIWDSRYKQTTIRKLREMGLVHPVAGGLTPLGEEIVRLLQEDRMTPAPPPSGVQ